VFRGIRRGPRPTAARPMTTTFQQPRSSFHLSVIACNRLIYLSIENAAAIADCKISIISFSAFSQHPAALQLSVCGLLVGRDNLRSSLAFVLSFKLLIWEFLNGVVLLICSVLAAVGLMSETILAR